MQDCSLNEVSIPVQKIVDPLTELLLQHERKQEHIKYTRAHTDPTIKPFTFAVDKVKNSQFYFGNQLNKFWSFAVNKQANVNYLKTLSYLKRTLLHIANDSHIPPEARQELAKNYIEALSDKLYCSLKPELNICFDNFRKPGF